MVRLDSSSFSGQNESNLDMVGVMVEEPNGVLWYQVSLTNKLNKLVTEEESC